MVAIAALPRYIAIFHRADGRAHTRLFAIVRVFCRSYAQKRGISASLIGVLLNMTPIK